MSQENDFAGRLYNSYDNYKESALKHKRFKHNDILPLIEKLKNNPAFDVSVAGNSVYGREIFLVSTGTGNTRVFMWSQMHGDESTATMALFDIFNFLSAKDEFDPVREKILQNTTLYFMPMVNPDGAELFKRRNSFDIDINRDAARNTTPEGKVLKEIFDYLKADFGFNLHDQGIYYAAGRHPRSAALSFLAPASEFSKGIDSVRNNAMLLISQMHKVLSEFIPGHMGRYNDDHEPRAFGDNFQKWGTSTILIETGGWKDDPQKQFLRKMNFVALTSTILAISEKSYRDADISTYEKIPFNEELLKDLVIRNLIYEKNGVKIKIDVSADRIERASGEDIEYLSMIDDIGDLSVFYGYEDYDLEGYEIHPGKIYPKKTKHPDKISQQEFLEMLKQGYTSLVYDGDTKSLKGKYCMDILKSDKRGNDIAIGRNASFYLVKDGSIDYVFVNSFLYDTKNDINKIINSFITR